MITYNIWKSTIEDCFDYYTSNSFKILIYSLLSLFSIFIILIDILIFPFEIIGVMIFLIEKINRRSKRL